MKKSKLTKRALLVSVLSMMLCLSMLVGSTFAWFTDSVTSGKNKIVAGNLDVELEYKDADGTWKPVNPDASLFLPADSTKWEPGHTEYTQLKIRNAGSLALSYKFTANVFSDEAGTMAEKQYTGQNGPFLLSDYLVFSRTDGAAAVTSRESLWIADEAAEKALMGTKAFAQVNTEFAPLLPGESKEMTLAVYMPTWVGNEANQLTSAKATEGEPTIYFGLNLLASQTPHEVDSFGNDYDVAADPDYNPFAEKDEEALKQGYAYRKADGTYGTIKASSENSFLLDVAYQGEEATLIKDIGKASTSFPSKQADYSNKNSVFDLNGHTYTFGGLELKQNYGKVTENSSLEIKNGTMQGSINFDDILKSYNAMQEVTLDHVNMKWGNPLAWNAKDPNYYGLNLSTETAGTSFTVRNSVLDCNAKFYTNTNFSNPADRPIVNITGTTVNGRLNGSSVDMTVKGCTVNGEVYCSGSWRSATTVAISDSTINGNAYFDASSSQKNDVAITNTVINGNLQTDSSRNNVHFTLTDVTVTGTLGYSNSSWNIPADKVTIVSGTYGFDPTNYLASGSAVTDNGNGTWTVTAG